ncbi:MAG: histidinol-phosphatase HisJ family protein [Eggerthellaceae bacterium]|nr:histidinol-phosphatase HisJ family protein [Eggerthellaceae bacterium]
MELVNTHAHTALCGHGEGSVEELVASAVAAGVGTLAVTEHYPLTPRYDPDEFLSMPARYLEEYCDTVERVRTGNPGIEILLGCEFDWLGTAEDRDLSAVDFARFELVLGSVHFVDGWAFDSPSSRGRWEELGADYIWDRYFDTWCEAVLSDLPFTVMAHPDLAKKFGHYPSFGLEKHYQKAAEACRVAGRMVEVNTSGAHYACKEMYPAPALLREFCRAGVPCTLGTDAHHPDNAARGIQDGYHLLYECGYREVTVPTREGDRRRVTIE